MGKEKVKTYTIHDGIIAAEVLIIGLAEAAHLSGLVFGWTFSRCALLFWGLAGAVLAGGAVFSLVRACVCRSFRFAPGKWKAGLFGEKPMERKTILLCVFFLLMVLYQLIFILKGDTVYVDRDMTAETVESFLVTDRIYSVNPMTGMPYQQGMPFRLAILCLPTLYGSLCQAAGLAVTTVVWKIVPAVILVSSYIAFGALGHCLFPEEAPKRLCFLAAAALLMWVGTYMYGMDGFGLLYCGWRGVSIRNGVLAPWLLSLCIRKKWCAALLCILAEACITWTLYGFGVCAAILFGMIAAGLCRRVFWRREHIG